MDKANLIYAFELPPIYVVYPSEKQSIQDEIADVIKKVKFNNSIRDWGKTQLLSTTDFHDNCIETYNLNTLSKVVDLHVRNYCDIMQMQYDDYDLFSWITLNHRNSYSHIHSHGQADISGCYYFSTNGNDGSIFFEHPTPQILCTNSGSSFLKKYTVEPEIGKLLLFAGWYKHGVTTNTTDNQRISIAFNVKFKYS